MVYGVSCRFVTLNFKLLTEKAKKKLFAVMYTEFHLFLHSPAKWHLNNCDIWREARALTSATCFTELVTSFFVTQRASLFIYFPRFCIKAVIHFHPHHAAARSHAETPTRPFCPSCQGGKQRCLCFWSGQYAWSRKTTHSSHHDLLCCHEHHGRIIELV